MRTLKDIPELKNKKVIIRVDFNTPLDEDGNILSDKRIKHAIPTIKYLLERGVKQLIIITHLGRPKKNEDILKTNKLAIRLSELLETDVLKMDDWGENGLPEDKIILLENLRFNKAEKSKDEIERDKFGKELSQLADLYINEAFSNSHREHASMTSIPKFIPSYAGMGLEQEITSLECALKNPERPLVAIIGGVKADKLHAVENLINTVDYILMAGAVAFELLKFKGTKFHNEEIDCEGLECHKNILFENVLKSKKVYLPFDAVVADKFSNDAHSKIVLIKDIEDPWLALDIGPETVGYYLSILNKAKTVLWFGPIGVFEMDKFNHATKSIAHKIASLNATTIIGGGDSALAVENLNLEDKMTLISTGGGASLKLLEGNSLVAVDILN